MYLTQYLQHEILLLKDGKKRKSDFFDLLKNSFGEILDYMMNDIVRSGEIHKGLGKIDNELKDKITLKKKFYLQHLN